MNQNDVENQQADQQRSLEAVPVQADDNSDPCEAGIEHQSIHQLIDQAAAEQWEELDLSGWQLEELPPEIGKLTQLQRLILGKWDKEQNQGIGIGLKKLPDQLAELVNLTELILTGNQLTEIPACVPRLSKLTTLHIDQNQLTEVTPTIVHLTNLKNLDLGQNQINEIPEYIAQLTNLTKLIFATNQISEIPACIGQLSNLTKLSLSGNQISEIPACIGLLSNLTRLSLSQNQISEIPACLGQLSNLTELRLTGNQISQIPAWITQLTNLTVLRLSDNQIREIPDNIAQLTNLTVLRLIRNQIGEIPESIAQLTSLIEISLGGNQISEIPACIGQLSNLTKLYLGGNQISEIPVCIGLLSNLTELTLWGNQISEIPACIGQLSNLTTLDLGVNQISEIPACIGQLSNLTRLDLNHNAIRQLPQGLASLEALTILHLEGNPLSIPPETLRLGWGEKIDDPGNPQAILNYYFTTRDPNQTQTLYEVKLLLVGEGGAGKTSLANKLLDAGYSLKPETEDHSTKGIDILKWKFTGRDGNAYCISIWDFGGQEIYHQTHQFFLTERSLYLLVADSRKEDTDHYFWLKTIQLLGSDSPVLLIQNEKQNRICNLNFNQLRGEFTNLRDTYRINLSDNRGLSDLQAAIQYELEKLIPNGIPFPNKWLAVRYALANDGRNYIDCTEYEATCRQHGITNREEMFQLSQFLHDLGICLHFQKDPILRHRLILKPNWGTAAVYKILDDDTVKLKNRGRFSDADLKAIWVEPEYAEMHDQLLQLMKEFKVCYEIPRRKGQYIAPHLLSADSPSYGWQPENNLTLRYRYKSFMPKGILTRFIVEMHQEIENVSDPDQALVWKSGVVLTNGSARAQIIEYYPQQKITIHVSGNRPRDLLTVINRKFQEIHDSFEDRLDYDTLIPCNCDACKPSQETHVFLLNTLYQYIDKGRPTIQCYASGQDVNVRGLIDGVIIETPEYFNELDDDARPNFSRELRYDRSGRQRRYQPRPDPQTQNPIVNLAFTVQNNNQQDQEIRNQTHQNSQSIGDISISGNNNPFNAIQAGENVNLTQTNTQTSGSDPGLQAALTALGQLKQSIRVASELDETEKEMVEIPIKKLEAELRKPQPDKSIVDRAVAALKKSLDGALTLTEPVATVTDLIANAWMGGS